MSNSKKTNKEVELIATTPKKYNIMILFNPVLNDQVDDTIAKNKLKCDRRITGYARFDAVSEEDYNKIKSLFKECSVTNTHEVRVFDKEKKTFVTHTKERVLTPQIVATRAKITVWVEKKKTNNTKEARQAARARRKASNIAKHRKFEKHSTNEKKKSTKENPVPSYGRKAKVMTFRHGKHKFKSVAKVTPATKETNLAKKLRQRAQKAGQYLIKKEAHASSAAEMEAKLSKAIAKHHKPKKPVQQKFKFAA